VSTACFYGPLLLTVLTDRSYGSLLLAMLTDRFYGSSLPAVPTDRSTARNYQPFLRIVLRLVTTRADGERPKSSLNERYVLLIRTWMNEEQVLFVLGERGPF
jgi:hypothetical protein